MPARSAISTVLGWKRSSPKSSTSASRAAWRLPGAPFAPAVDLPHVGNLTF